VAAGARAADKAGRRDARGERATVALAALAALGFGPWRKARLDHVCLDVLIVGRVVGDGRLAGPVVDVAGSQDGGRVRYREQPAHRPRGRSTPLDKERLDVRNRVGGRDDDSGVGGGRLGRSGSRRRLRRRWSHCSECGSSGGGLPGGDVVHLFGWTIAPSRVRTVSY
jgi:hypothetical protein